MKPIRNVIFDWSGTLANDLPPVLKATNYVLRQCKCPVLTMTEFRKQFVLPFQLFYDRLVPGVPMEKLERWYHEAFFPIQDEVALLPHAMDFLKFCKQQKFRTFILSTIRDEHYEIQSRKLRVRQYIDHPYVEILDKRLKIKSIIKDHQLDPAETLFVGDMVHDVETAKLGGVVSVAVLTGFTHEEELRKAEPDLVINHLGELKKWILDRAKTAIEAVAELPRFPISTVGALIFNRSDLLMVRTAKWSNKWGIPGGKIKWGETSIDALKREIKEETGLAIFNIKFELVQDCIHSREFIRDAHFLLLNYSAQSRSQKVVLNDEAQEWQWLAPKAALKLDLNIPTRILVEHWLNGNRD